nr:aminoglycoside phosphotransferase family protein [Glycomyces tenuis]
MSEVTRARAAATSVAASLGLPVTGTTVLHNSNKLALRLTPCDVFARIAPVGQEVAQFEIELAQRLAEVGSPVCPLEPRADPRVYTRDGFTVTLWTYYEPAAPGVSPVDYAKALELLHLGMREVDVPSPRFTDRVAEAEAIIADPERSPGLPEADRVFLGGRLASLRRAIEERGAAEQLLHGEPHPGNVLSTEGGPLFIDFETCCRGPVEFDLAHVPEAVCEHYPGIDQGLLDECRQLVLAMVAAWRWERGDEFPNRRLFQESFLRALREGPPWPTLDTMNRLVGLEPSPKALQSLRLPGSGMSTAITNCVSVSTTP